MPARKSTFLTPTYEISFRFRRILVPVDGSESSLRALDVAVDFAKRYGSRVVVVTSYVKGQEEFAKVALERARSRCSDAGIPISFKSIEVDPHNSSVPNSIVKEAAEGGYDLVIMGARGLTVSEDVQVGSVAMSVIINSPVSVLVIR